MKEPLIGILMATYNGEKFIKEQINSILNQIYKNWELIIHDDGSTDSTVDIVKEYAKKHPDRIIFIDDGIKCGGAKENFAHLMQIAKDNFNFDYIMFSDQDDVWLPNKIEITLNKMLNVEHEVGKDKPILIHTDLKVVDEHLNVIAKSFWKYQKINPQHNTFNRLLVQNIVAGCTTMVNRTALELALPIPHEAIMHDYWLALVTSAFGQITFLESPTLLYRIHSTNDYGVTNYDLKYIITNIKDLFLYKKRARYFRFIKQQVLQACTFFKRYNGLLSDEHINILKDFCNIMNKNWFKRRIIIFKNRLFRSGCLKTLGLLILI